jgi:hypothetical protein
MCPLLGYRGHQASPQVAQGRMSLQRYMQDNGLM